MAWCRPATIKPFVAVAAALLLAAKAAAATGGEEGLRPTLLEVSVNGQDSPEPQMMLIDADGQLYASEAALRRWRLRIPSGAPVRFDGTAYHPLAALPSLRTKLLEAEQRLAIDAPAILFDSQETSLHPRQAMPMTRPATGGYLNYDLFVEHVRGGVGASGLFEAGLFSRFGVGSSSFTGHVGPGEDSLRRLETSWRIDRPERMDSIRIGDSITRGGPSAPPVRFGGIQFGRNFAVQPGFITIPLPTLAGSAAVPSVVDVYVNNALQGSREVAPGPFRIHDVPVPAGAGQVQLVVRDLLGRDVAASLSYYASGQMLRRGLRDYSYELGFVRRGFGRTSNDYGAFLAATTQRYGLSDKVTGEANLQLSEDGQLGAAGFIAGLGDFGLLNLSAGLSRSELGTGHSASISLERRTRGLSLGAGADYHNRDFALPGEAAGPLPPRIAARFFADLPFRGGAIGLNIVHRDQRDGPNETVIGGFVSRQIARAGTLQLFARHTAAGTSQRVVGAHFAVALGGHRSASAHLELEKDSPVASLGYQHNPPAGEGSGYRVHASAGPVERFEGAYVRNTSRATYAVQLGHAAGETGARASMAGAIGVNGGALFASRAIGQSFATVKVGDHQGIRVYADNQLVGTTNAKGELVIPSLRSYERNLIRIDDSDFPMDVQLGRSEIALRPFARTGNLIRFTPRRERGALLRVLLEDGRPVPAGALLFAEGQEEGFVVAAGGEAYLVGLDPVTRLRAQWSGGSCRFSVRMPDDDDPQPRLPDAVCIEEITYVSR